MSSYIPSLQIFRGLAALAVVGHHAVGSTSDFIESTPSWINATIGQGNYGVDFFFVLSGFIIMYIHQHDTKSFSNAKMYLKKRFLRVYPVYWLVTLILGISYFLLPGLSESGERNINLITTIFLLPVEGLTILNVGWTLVHEVMFYLFFLLFFYSTRVFYIFVLFWIASILIINLSDAGGIEGGRYIFSLFNIEFVIGMIAAKAMILIKSKVQALTLIIIGITLGILSLMSIVNGLPTSLRLVFSLGMAMLIIGTANIELNQKIRWPNILILLGNASFSIYLIHNPALSITQRIFGKLGIGWELGLGLGVVLTTVAGILFYSTVEKAIIKSSKKFFIKPKEVSI